MLIFDKFPSRRKAQAFIDAVKEIFPTQEGIICKSQEAADEIDFFPSVLTPPIVLINRDDFMPERVIEAIAPCFGGHFAGT